MRSRGDNQDRDTGPRVAGVCARASHLALALGRFALALGLVASCQKTTDSLGFDLPLKPLTPRLPYPTPFKDRGHSDADINAKINTAFMQLFHGDAMTEAIYVVPPGSTGIAYIHDVLHDDIRTEGIGLGMLIAVELDHRDEFDSLWTYAKTKLRVPSGAAAGYFNSFCDDYTAATVACLDPFGLQQMTMALLLAHDHFTTRGRVDYATDARELLTLLQYKVEQDAGIVDGVTGTFDGQTHLVYDVPNISAAAAGVGRPSIEAPGYYDLWAQATGDPFWTNAASAARDYWRRTANATTGLTPIRATFAGVPVTNYGVFSSEAYRAQIAMALDQIWVGGDGWSPGEADRLLGFFAGQGPIYGMSFALDGTPINQLHDPALVAANGVSAAIATTDRTAFVEAVWEMPVPNMVNRYFAGLLYLISLLVLGGQMQVL
jgi:oligosaccharide reducing-end xylanase